MHATRTSIKLSYRCTKSKLITNAHKNTNNIWLQMHTRGQVIKFDYRCTQEEQEHNLVASEKKTKNLKMK